LRDADLAEDRLRLLSNAPVIFQENVRGADIRVFVLDGKILCALEIEMETENVDFRGHEKAIRIIQVPRDVEAQCLAAAAICSLVFTGIDLKRTADGRYVILECNPSSMFIGFARMSGFPIDERLADFLLKS
jgi:glutathione synthase/RimK-type ligase-like ATP-grasp enzyme